MPAKAQAMITAIIENIGSEYIDLNETPGLQEVYDRILSSASYHAPNFDGSDINMLTADIEKCKELFVVHGANNPFQEDLFRRLYGVAAAVLSDASALSRVKDGNSDQYIEVSYPAAEQEFNEKVALFDSARQRGAAARPVTLPASEERIWTDSVSSRMQQETFAATVRPPTDEIGFTAAVTAMVTVLNEEKIGLQEVAKAALHKSLNLDSGAELSHYPNVTKENIAQAFTLLNKVSNSDKDSTSMVTRAVQVATQRLDRGR